MDVRLDENVMLGIIQKSILDSLTPEKREAIIGEAVKSLLTVPVKTGMYHDPKSPLQEAFNQAIREVARKVAEEELAKDGTVREKTRKLLIDAWEKLTNSETYSKTVEKVAYAIEKRFVRKRILGVTNAD